MLHPLEQKIETVARRARRLVLLHGLSCFLAVVLVAAVVLGLGDYLLRLEDRGVRYICWAVWLALSGWAFLRFLWPALWYRPSPVRTALQVERAFPQLRDRVSSSLEFLRQQPDDPAAGSAELRRAVVAQTLADVEGVDFQRSLDGRVPRRVAALAVAVLATILLLVWLDPSSAALAARRLLLPGTAENWPHWNALAFEDPPTRLARGQDFEVSLVDRKGRLPDQVVIYYQFDDEGGRILKRQMRPRGNRMVDRLENITRSFHYRAEGGDDRAMPWFRVEVEDPVQIVQMQVTLHPLEYTGWEPSTSDPHIRALVGTRVELEVSVDKPLERAVLHSDPPEVVGEAELELSRDGRRLKLPAGADPAWIVEHSGSYWLELVDRQGLHSGSERRWQVQAISDEAPTVSVERPEPQAAVTSQALVPLQALVKDDLSIQRVELRYRRSDQSDLGDQTVVLYEKTRPAVPESPLGVLGRGESQEVLSDWNLAQMMQLEPGDQIEYHLAAVDFKPQLGQSNWRRLSIISADQLEDQLAQRRSAILNLLAEALQAQRQSRSQVKSLEIQLDTADALGPQDVDHLQSAELNQRQVGRLLGGSSESVTLYAKELLSKLQSNRVESPEVERRMQQLLEEVERLRQAQVPVIERELLASLKMARSQQPVAANLRSSLGTAGVEQDEVVRSLEALLGQLSQWDSYRRFARDLGRMRDLQREISDETDALRVEVLARDVRDLDAQQRARLKRLAEQQAELGRRFDALQARMQEMTEQLEESDPLAAQTLREALEVGRQWAIGGQMRESGRNIEQNRVGQAAEDQQDIQEGLGEMLDVLANRRDTELARIAEMLSDARQELDRIEQQQAELQQAMHAAGQQPDSQQRQGQLQGLSEQQQALQESANRLARQLKRLEAQDSSQAVDQAVQQMQQASEAAAGDQAQEAAERAQEAQQQLARAQQALAQEMQQAQQDLFFEQLARLEQFVAGLVEQHQSVVDEALRLDQLRTSQQGQLTDAQAASVLDLAAQERMLAQEASALSEEVGESTVFRASLQGAAAAMLQAAENLERKQTGSPTQTALEHAQARLVQLLEALQPEPLGQQQEQPPPEGGDQPTQPPPLVPPQDALHALAELKLLKLMQEEINRRTEQLQQQRTGDDSLDPLQEQELQRLSQEQGRLAEMLLDLSTQHQRQEGSL